MSRSRRQPRRSQRRVCRQRQRPLWDPPKRPQPHCLRRSWQGYAAVGPRIERVKQNDREETERKSKSVRINGDSSRPGLLNPSQQRKPWRDEDNTAS